MQISHSLYLSAVEVQLLDLVRPNLFVLGGLSVKKYFIMFFACQIFLIINKHLFSFIILYTLITIYIAILCFHLLHDLKYFFSRIASINDFTKPFLFCSFICCIESFFLSLKARLLTATFLLIFPQLPLCLCCLVHILVPPPCYFALRGFFSSSAVFISCT